MLFVDFGKITVELSEMFGFPANVKLFDTSYKREKKFLSSYLCQVRISSDNLLIPFEFHR